MVTTETTRKNQAILPLQKRGEDKAEASSLSEVAFEMEWQCADEDHFESGEGETSGFPYWNAFEMICD